MLARPWPSTRLVLTLAWLSPVSFIARVFVTVTRMMDPSTTQTCLQWSVWKLVYPFNKCSNWICRFTDWLFRCMYRDGVPVDVLAKLQFCYRWSRRLSNHSCHQHVFLSGRLRSGRLRNVQSGREEGETRHGDTTWFNLWLITSQILESFDSTRYVHRSTFRMPRWLGVLPWEPAQTWTSSHSEPCWSELSLALSPPSASSSSLYEC